MPSPSGAIIEELREAFPSKRGSRFFPLVNSAQGDEPLWIIAAFDDKDDWTKLTPEWLDAVPRGLGSALSFLADGAACYYIPAFIIADMTINLTKVDPTFTLTHGFDHRSRNRKVSRYKDETWGDYAFARWSSLTQKQAAAIVHYLEWRVERDGFFNIAHNKVVEALGAYWYARAAGLEPDFQL